MPYEESRDFKLLEHDLGHRGLLAGWREALIGGKDGAVDAVHHLHGLGPHVLPGIPVRDLRWVCGVRENGRESGRGGRVKSGETDVLG